MSSCSSGPGRGLFVLVTVLAILSLLIDPSPGGVSPAGPLRAGAASVQTLVLQPDGANGTDTFLLDVPLWWNFGTNASLLVGRNASAGSIARSLLRFDLSALPPGASIVNASLELYSDVGSSGTIDAYRVAGSWTEGTGDRAWRRVRVTVRETAGLSRTLEPVAALLPFVPYDVGDPARDLRVWAGSQETPSQVYNYTVAGGHVVQATAHFGATVGPNGTKEFYITYSTNETAVPGYRTRGFGALPLWVSPPVGLGASSPSVVDLDGDGSLEVVYGTQSGYVQVVDASGTPRWSASMTGDSVPFPPQVRDVDGDGNLDVVAVTGGGMLVRMNNTGGIQWMRTIGGSSYSTPALLDVDADGVLDALVGTSNAVEAYSLLDGTFIRSYSASGTRTDAPSVADLDGDGNAEIVFGAVDSNVHAFDPAGLERYMGAAPGSAWIRNTVAIGDLDGDGLPEIVTGDDASVGPEFSWNPRTNTTQWSTLLPDRRRGHQTLADVDGDGALDVVVGVGSGEVFALNGRNGTTLWSRFVGSTQALAPAVADLDRDGRPEFVCVSELGSLVQVLNATGDPIHSWAIEDFDPGIVSSQPESTTPVIADVDGDGTLEVLVPTGAGIVAFGTAGLARDWRTLGYNWNHTHRAGDGTSPDGAPPLDVTVGGAQPFPALGASWLLSDGIQPWVVQGGDFVLLEDSVPAGAGWLAWNVTSAVTDWYQGTYPNTGLLLYDPAEMAGELHEFHSSDSASANLRPVLRITYAPAFVDPTPQIVGPVPDFTRLEDSAPWSTSLSGLANDADTPLASLQWNLSGYDPAVLQITGINTPGNHVLTFYPQPDAWGSMRVTYWLSDPEGNAAWREAWINITPVNDAPRFDPPASLVVKHDLAYVFDFSPYIADVDDPPSSLTLVSDDPTHTNVTGFLVSFLFPVSYVDQWAFVGLIVSDGRASAGKVVAVKVTRDDPPVLTLALPDVTMQEGETVIGVFDLDGYFTDPNNDTLFFSYGYSHLAITIHGNHSVDIAAESNWFGAERVTFRGTDPYGALAEDTIVVTVLPVNDPPVLGPVPDLRVRYDANYTFNLEPYISDPDTPLEAIVVTTSSPYVTVTGRLLTLLYPFSLNGTVQDLTILASDGTSTASRTIRVTVGDDWPPVLTRKLGDRTLLEDGTILGAYDLRAFFTDPDGETLYFSSGNVNVLVSIDTLGVVNLSAVRDWFGAERVTFRARDALGALAEDTLWIAVLPVNDAPSFRSIPTLYLNTTSGVVDLTQYLVDVDTNVSDLALTSSSANVTVVGRSLVFHYRSDADERLEIVASDGFLEGRAFVEVVVRLPRTMERLPPILWWLFGIGGVATVVSVAVWRYRRVEWVFLVTNGGLLLASVFRRGSASVDTDLMAGMMTAIMDFAKVSFSDEKPRELDEFSLGDRRVELVQGKHGYLAAVYAGRTPGRLEHIMKSLLAHIEERHPGAFHSLVDTTEFKDIPVLLKRFMDRAWWPFLSFPSGKSSGTPRE